ncbi:MAG: alpha/beta fold hydrolase [Acidimicrobiales bacterium]
MNTSPTDRPTTEDDRSVTGSGGLRLAAQERNPGVAPTVLLVHGYPDTHTVWDLVADRLAVDHHVVTYDVRGAGASGIPPDRAGYAMAHLVADLVAVADAVSPDEPVHLVGHDWGSVQSWAAVTDPVAAERIAGFTSISGPHLAHAGRWVRERSREGPSGWGKLARQASRSWYVAAFQTPLAPMLWRRGLGRRWPERMAQAGATVDDRWPGPTLTDDAARGVELYRANRARAAGPAPYTDVAVQLVVPADDPFVTPALLDGIEAIAPDLTRLDVAGGHWLPRSHPAEVADWVATHVAAVTG